MSQYSTKQVLAMIVESGGPEHLNLTRMDLTCIDLSASTIQRIFVEEVFRSRHLTPPAAWNSRRNYHLWYSGIKRSSEVRRRAIERGTTALGDPRAGRVEIKRGIVLSGANLQGADLTGAQLQGADLQGANLSFCFLHGADLSGARLWDVDLSHARLGRARLLPFPTTERTRDNLPLKPRERPQRVALQNAILHWTDFSAAQLVNVLFYHAKLSETRLQLSQIRAQAHTRYLNGVVWEEVDGRWEEARIAYAGLRKNFIEGGQYKDAADAYFRERLMEERAAWPSQSGTLHVQGVRRRWSAKANQLRRRRGLWPWLVRSVLSLFLHIMGGDRISVISLWWLLPLAPKAAGVKIDRLRWLGLWLGGRLTGYWESITRVGLLALITIVVFGVIYEFSGVCFQRADTGLPHSLLFSLRTFTTLAYNDFQPKGLWANLATGTEAALGPVMLALFVFVLGKRLRGY